MIPLDWSRLRHVDMAELAWRARAATDTLRGRLACAVSPPRWNRHDLAAAFSHDRGLSPVTELLRAERWKDAHDALAHYVQEQPARFVIAPQMRSQVSAAIRARFPTAVGDACARGDRLLNGRYDLLGYRDLTFDGDSWHSDPVHGKSAPAVFWSQVPYLDHACGDHKVTWEFNRHQHWLELGRAYWLSGDARYRDECLQQLKSWLEVNPPLIGINWASMLELAFRSLSWMWALNFFAGDAQQDESPWLVDLLLGLDRQLTHVERHLSYYFSPNTHLLGEALALYVAGRALPFLRASARRERIGRDVLLQEITRQIAPDGGHCERSPHYHRYTLDFYLLALVVSRLTDDPAASVFERTCARLAHTTRVLADDDGILPRIGDDDGGSLLPITRRRTDDVRDSLAIAAALTGQLDVIIGAAPEELWWMLAEERFRDGVARVDSAPRPPAQKSTALPATGYFVSRSESGSQLIIDGGPHGYLNGGHAHADALALYFTHHRRPLLIDAGTGCYTVDPQVRDRFRSSALHNTLTLDGRSQSLPRGPFHWQHTADGRVCRWRTSRRFDYFVGTHDGYSPVAHYRHALMLHDDVLVVADCVVAGAEPGGHAHEAAVHWHLAPDWIVETHDRGARIQHSAEIVDLSIAGGVLDSFRGDTLTGLGWHAPEYGRIEPTQTLRITAAGTLPVWIVSVFGLDPLNRVQHVALEPVHSGNASLLAAMALTLRRERTVDSVVFAEPVSDSPRREWRAVGFECNASMLFVREIDRRVRHLAATDVTMIASERCPSARHMYPSCVADLYLEFTADVHLESTGVSARESLALREAI